MRKERISFGNFLNLRSLLFCSIMLHLVDFLWVNFFQGKTDCQKMAIPHILLYNSLVFSCFCMWVVASIPHIPLTNPSYHPSHRYFGLSADSCLSCQSAVAFAKADDKSDVKGGVSSMWRVCEGLFQPLTSSNCLISASYYDSCEGSAFFAKTIFLKTKNIFP